MHIIAFLNPQLDGADIKALNMAIDALEQEPCDDAISREAVLKEAHWINVDGERFEVVQDETLLGLPSVQPSRKGQWIAHSDGGIWIKYYECSECRARYDTLTNFCPNCGADMRESEVSE